MRERPWRAACASMRARSSAGTSRISTSGTNAMILRDIRALQQTSRYGSRRRRGARAGHAMDDQHRPPGAARRGRPCVPGPTRLRGPHAGSARGDAPARRPDGVGRHPSLITTRLGRWPWEEERSAVLPARAMRRVDRVVGPRAGGGPPRLRSTHAGQRGCRAVDEAEPGCSRGGSAGGRRSLDVVAPGGGRPVEPHRGRARGQPPSRTRCSPPMS